MTDAIFTALQVPDDARVDQRVPKKLLLENGAHTASDKRLLTEAVEDIQWLAALKPTTIGVPEHRDMQREYLEIAVLAVTLRGTITPASLARLAEVVHRAVPYPVLLLLVDGPTRILSLAHKRWAQNEADKVVLDGDPVWVSLSQTAHGRAVGEAKGAADIEEDFLQSLALTRQPQLTLHALYQGWMDCVQTLHAARRTGSYQIAETVEQAAARRQALADCQRLENEISRLRAQASKEKQIARQVELNLALKRAQAELAAAQQLL